MVCDEKTMAINAKLAVKHWNAYNFAEAFLFAGKADADDPAMMRIRGYGYLYGNGTDVDEEKGRRLLEAAIAKGDVEAKAELGYLYMYGNAGCVQDYNRAEKLFREAAESGSAFAAGQLGCMYRDGFMDGDADYAMAIEWFKKGYDGDDSESTVNLAYCYYDGTGVSRDFSMAFELLQKAADQNNIWALDSLGWMCEHGEGTNVDVESAIEYYQKAAELGNEQASVHLDNIRDALKDTVGALKAAKGGDAMSQFNVAYWYYCGINGLPQDFKSALKWYMAAADSGFEKALINLGGMYWEGQGCMADRCRAIELWQRCADNGNSEALNALGRAYQDEEFLDCAKAVMLLQKSAERGFTRSMVDLGNLYQLGKIVEKNHKRAYEWYLKAAMSGDPGAQWAVARMCERGEGVPMNLEESEKWYLASAEQGYGDSNDSYLRVSRRRKLSERRVESPESADDSVAERKQASAETVKENVKLAKAAFAQMDYSSAFKYALNGDLEDRDVQFILGYCLREGKGVRKMEDESARWLSKSAAAGHPEAQAELAFMYHDAIGVGQDYAKSRELFEQSTSAQCILGLIGLGKMLIAGEGGDKDIERGLSLCHVAADMGNVDAMKFLGEIYVDGIVVPKDIVQGCRFYEMAAGKGDNYSHERLGELYSHAKYGVLDYEKSVAHFMEGAKLGNMISMFNLGIMYENGYGVTKDMVKASEWYSKAEVAGYAKATETLKRLSYSKALYVADKQQNTPYQAFISYRRKGGRECARALYLELRYRGIKTFFDYTSLQHGDFNEDILKAIEEAPNFIMMVTDGAFDRCSNEGDWVRKEIEYAKKLGKNIVPVAPTGHQKNLSCLPDCFADIRTRQIFRLDMENLFEESVGKIITQCLKGF